MSTLLAKKNKHLSKKHASRAADLIQKAWKCYQAGQLHDAEICCLSLLDKYPKYADGILLLGLIAQQVGQIELAISRYQQVLAIKPNSTDAHYNLGNALQLLRLFDQAIDCYQKSLSYNPNFYMAYNNLGIIYIELGQLEKAVFYLNKAISINPDYDLAQNNLGNALKDLGRYIEAKEHFEIALKINPDYIDAYNNFGALLQNMGQKEEAAKNYKMALSIKPDFAASHFNLSKIEPDQEHITNIERLLGSTELSDEDAIYYHYALGNISNHIKSYSKEFEHYLKGNELKRKTLNYDSTENSKFIDSLIGTYTEKYFQEKTGYGSDSTQPVFIVGMPRSGTTLVEQIISSHSQVYGADELETIKIIALDIKKQFESASHYPECMTFLDKTSARKFSKIYLNDINRYSSESKRITDKMPVNFIHIGLIKTLFPKAKIIHCKRHPLDTCTSIFLNNFVSGNDYSYDLTEIGKYYLDYERLMTHWHTVLPSEIFDVSYEELVSEQETISRQLINYLELDWDDDCLNFHQNERAVRTASNLQVRQPIYTKSLQRWQRYEQHLQPLFDILKNEHLIN